MRQITDLNDDDDDDDDDYNYNSSITVLDKNDKPVVESITWTIYRNIKIN
jgi:hypothetical protein